MEVPKKIKLDAREKIIAAMLGTGLTAIPLLAGLFAAGALGSEPNIDMAAIILLVGTVAVVIGIVRMMPSEMRKMLAKNVNESYLWWKTIGLCLGLMLAGSLAMMVLVRIGVEKIIAGNIGYGVFALITFFIIVLGFSSFLLWLHLKDKEFYEKLIEDQSSSPKGQA